MKLKSLTSLALSLLLCAFCFAGCSKEPAPSLPAASAAGDSLAGRTGVYVEEELSPDHFNPLGLFWANGAVNYFSVENPLDPLPQWTIHWYTLNQDDTWSERSDHAFEDVSAAAPEEAFSAKPYLTPDGTLYWQVIQQSGGLASLDFGPFEQQDSYFVVDNGSAQKISAPPKGEASLFFDEETNQLTRCGDMLLRFDTGAELHFFDLDGNAANLETPVPEGMLLCGNQNGYYIYNRDDHLIRHYTVGGTTAEIVMDAGRFSLTNPDCRPYYALAAEDDTLYILTYKGTNINTASSSLFRYRWDSSYVPQDNGSLTVFSLYPSQTITAAAQLLEKRTGAKVEYHHALEDTPGDDVPSDEGSITVNDVLTQLNAQLLSGTGPDVLILDGLPADSLIEKNALLDLTDLISTQDLLPNLASVYKTDSGLFALPSRCHPLLVIGSQQNLDEITTAEDAAKELAGETTIDENFVDWRSGQLPLFAYQSTADLFNHFYSLYASRIWQNNTLNEGAYREFVTLIGNILSTSGTELTDFPLDQNTHPYYQLYVGSHSSYINKLCRVGCDFFMAPVQFLSDYSPSSRDLLNNPGVCEAKPFVSQDGTSCVYPAFAAAVNAGSQNPEMAVEFINILLSDEIQCANHYEGFPVRISSLQNLWQQELAQNEVTSHTDIVALLEGLDAVPRNEFLRKAAAKGMMAWQKTHSVDDAVETAQNTIKLWLAEQ